MDYLAEMDIHDLPEVETLSAMDWDNAPLTLNDEGRAVLTLGPEADSLLASVNFSLYYTDPDSDSLLMLGRDNDIVGDWENRRVHRQLPGRLGQHRRRCGLHGAQQ